MSRSTTTPRSSARNGALATGPFESRVEQSVDRLLELLTRALRQGDVLRARRGRRGAIPRSCAGLPRRDTRVACHGDRHEDVYRQSPQRVPRTTSAGPRRGSRTSLGEPVIGYRAPNFSIGRAQAWAYRHPARGRIPLRLEHLPDPARPLRAAQRAALPVRDLARRIGKPDGVSDRHGAGARREPADRRRRLFPAGAADR